MLDRFVALIALASVAGFLYVFIWRVPELDLTIVLAIVVALAAFDFFGDLLRRRK